MRVSKWHAISLCARNYAYASSSPHDRASVEQHCVLGDAENAQRKRQVVDIDALFSETETIDLLPLSTLVALTERARAA